MARFRSHGWEPKELKIYWNTKQLENLCPKHETNDKQVPEKDETKNEEAREAKNKQIVAEDEGKDKQTVQEGEKERDDTNEAKNKQMGVEDEGKDKQPAEEGEAERQEASEATNKQMVTKDEGKNKQKVEEAETQREEAHEAKNKQIAVENKTDKAKDENLLSHDPSDADAVLALLQYPVSKRNHAGKITYVNKGIEKAVFDAPEDAQLIVLNFAVS